MTVSLTYFDFDGSRGLECRLALSVAGVDFEDIRIKRPEWAGLKPTLPYGALPMLQVGDKRLVQSNAILNFIGRGHDLHPEDSFTLAKHEALMQSVEDLRYKVPGYGLSDDEKKVKREEFAAGWLTQWAQTVSDEIAGPFLEGDKLHIADIKLYTILRGCLGGIYDHIPGSHFDTWPKLRVLHDAVDAHPGVRGYFDSRG